MNDPILKMNGTQIRQMQEKKLKEQLSASKVKKEAELAGVVGEFEASKKELVEGFEREKSNLIKEVNALKKDLELQNEAKASR